MDVYSSLSRQKNPWKGRFVAVGAVLAVLFFGYRYIHRKDIAPIELGERYDFQARDTSLPDGSVLAGTDSPLYEFSLERYREALNSDKLVVVYFYADWCPICREEFPLMQQAFNEMHNPNVVGFRVHFNDNETDNDEKALAQEHGIAYQHTKIFIRNNQKVLKSPVSWDKSKYIEEINATLNEGEQ